MTSTITTSEVPLRELAAEVFEVNQANGWFEDDRSVGDDLALLHTEAAETTEAYRRWGTDDVTGEKCETDSNGVHLHGPTPCKPEGVGSELADVLIRLLDTVTRRNVVPAWLDLPLSAIGVAQVREDWTFGDCMAYLHRVIADADPERILFVLVSIAGRYGVDLGEEYRRKIAFNRTRSHRHGGRRL